MTLAAAVNAAAADGGARMLLYVDNSLGDDISVADLGMAEGIDQSFPPDSIRLIPRQRAQQELKVSLTGE